VLIKETGAPNARRAARAYAIARRLGQGAAGFVRGMGARGSDQRDLNALAGILGKRAGWTERFVFGVRQDGEQR